jgi:hypothetical protein
MSEKITVERIVELASQLTPAERARLVDQLLGELRQGNAGGATEPGFDWMSIRGVAPGLMEEEDAQAWVTRTRRESDEQREKSLKRPR